MDNRTDPSRARQKERCRYCGHPLVIRYNLKEALIACEPCGYRYEDLAAECEIAALEVATSPARSYRR